MGNHKNKNNKWKSSHRHVYTKKKNPKSKILLPNVDREEQATEMDTEQQTESQEQQHEAQVGIQGCRIINIDKLQQFSDNLAKHSTWCDGSVILKGESRQGLASILTGECSTCSHTIRLQTSKKVKGPSGYNR